MLNTSEHTSLPQFLRYSIWIKTFSLSPKKVAVVTGAGSGIGRAEAQMLDRLGAIVIATDINEKTVAETAASFRSGGRCLRHDVTSEGDWAKAVANEMAAFGIRVNSLHPGGVQTNLNADWEPARDAAGNLIPPEQIAAHFLSLIPMGRIGEVSDIAPIIAFLASDAVCYVTGAEFVVNGGYTIR